MKSTFIHVCAKTAFVVWPSTESGRISSSHNFLSYNHYFRKCFKLVNIKNLVMVTLTTGITFLLFTCMHFWVWGTLRRWPACAAIAYEVARDCRKLEKHWPTGWRIWHHHTALFHIKMHNDLLTPTTSHLREADSFSAARLPVRCEVLKATRLKWLSSGIYHMQYYRYFQTFARRLLPPSSGWWISRARAGSGRYRSRLDAQQAYLHDG
jgi:hypothetical protein